MEGDLPFQRLPVIIHISTHALRMEGDCQLSFDLRLHKLHFYPRPPHGGRPCSQFTMSLTLSYFYPRPPHGGRHCSSVAYCETGNFYPRPPHGGRPIMQDAEDDNAPFLPTPSAWRATFFLLGFFIISVFLPTPSAWRATAAPTSSTTPSADFYPRPPHGGRRNRTGFNTMIIYISTHALRMEGDRTDQLFFGGT